MYVNEDLGNERRVFLLVFEIQYGVIGSVFFPLVFVYDVGVMICEYENIH